MILLKVIREGVGSVGNLSKNAIYILNYYKLSIFRYLPTPFTPF